MSCGDRLGYQVPNRTRDNLPSPRIEKPHITHLGLDCRTAYPGIALHKRRLCPDPGRRERSANAGRTTADNDDIIDWCIRFHVTGRKRQLLTPRNKSQQHE